MKILVSGGGTGGHIYPAVSLVEYIKRENPDAEFLYIGTSKGLESKIVPEKGIPFDVVEIQGFKRSLSLDNLKTVQLFLKSIKDAKRLINEFQPDIVIGTGGYVCAPVVYGAHKLGVPTIIHEQNSVAGLTNKFLSRYVDKIGICFSDVAKDFPAEKVVMVGNPRAQEVSRLTQSDVLKEYNLDPQVETVLVFGGSRGALSVNQAMIKALPSLGQKPYQILYVTGDIYFEEVQEAMNLLEFKPSNVKVVPYIKQMDQILANVTAVVSRAGATTMAEITGLGLPSVLIPSPNVTHDHQTKNAMSLVNKGAALLVRDDELTDESLIEAIDQLMLQPIFREDVAQKSKKEGIPDAMDKMYHLMQDVITMGRS